ncbi:hypothetical protein HD554DRAFT_643066 [Boletus coccyginus]|nr:hypothetical protein HD554DRAFT_643066 [Boletus coccyginus]
MWYLTPLLLLATGVLADYHIDNANSSVIYSMAPSESGVAWSNYSVNTQELALSFSNSTGNYTVPLDSSHCYDENYALGVCGTGDNCYVEMPFTGSGITMYVFNAGLSGMTASCSIDGGQANPNSIDAPPAPTYQISNVSLCSIQGLSSGNHTMKMTVLDWNGSATSMKFDYAYVNETFVATPATTSATSSMTSTSTSSQTPTQASAGNSGSNQVNLGAIIGGTLGGLALLAGVIGFFYWRRRKAPRKTVFSPESTFQVNPFTSEFSDPTPPPVPYTQRPFTGAQHRETSSSVPPLMRTAILRDALAAGNYSLTPDQSSQSVRSGQSSAVFQPLRRQPSYSITDTDPPLHSGVSQVADLGSPFSDVQVASRYGLTAEQVGVVERLRADNVPVETISRVIEGFVSSNLGLSADETTGRKSTRGARSVFSAAPPPSYQTQES